MNLKTVMALAIAAAFAAPVAAQTGGTAQPKDSNPAAPPAAGATAGGAFDTLDRNRDGYLSRDEARDAAWNNRFSELDKDNDDRLSRSEFGAMGSSGAGSGTTGGMDAKPGEKR